MPAPRPRHLPDPPGDVTWSFAPGDVELRSRRRGASLQETWNFPPGDVELCTRRPGASLQVTWSFAPGDVELRSRRRGASSLQGSQDTGAGVARAWRGLQAFF
eukprot:gene7049-biopygen15031